MINRGATLVSHLAVLIAVMFTLTACGGGGGGSTFYDKGDDNPPVTTAYSLALTLFDSSGAATTSLPQSAQGTIQVVVTDDNNSAAPVVGALVNVEVSAGTLSPTSATTDENGVVTVDITAGTVLGAVTITATTSVNSVTFTGVLSYEVVEFVPYLLELTLLGPDGQTTDALAIDTQGTLQAKITSADGSGAPVAGVLVNASTSIGILVPDSGRAITDANGIATLAVVAGTTAGAGVITTSAVVEGFTLNTDLNFEVTDEAIVITYFLQLTLMDSDGQATNTLDKAEQGTLRAKVTAGSADGVPISGALVAATTDIGTLAPSNGQLLSDDNGIVTFPVSAGSITGAGTIAATLQVGGATVDSSALNFQVADGVRVVTPYFVELTLLGPDGQPTTALAKNTQGTVQARITAGSESGSPVAGEIVNVSATIGSLIPFNGQALSNGSGFANLTAVAGSTIGAGSFTATIEIGGNTYTDILNYEVVDNIPYSIVLTLLGPDGQPTTTLAKNTQGTLQAKVTSTDGSDTPAVGVLVNANSTIGSLVPSNGQALSNSSGISTFTVSAGSTIAAGGITASVQIDGETFTDTENFEVVDNIPYTLELTLLGSDGEPTTALVKNTQGTLQAKITSTDGSNTPVASVLVSASSTIGSLAPSNGQALSNSSGIATFTVASGSTVSAGAVTASVQIGADTFTDILNFEIVDELYFLTLTLLDEDGEAATFLTERTEGSVQIVVTKDSETGSPVEGTIVTAATQLGSLEPNNGLTDSSGMVTLKFIAGSTIGASTLTASTGINGETISNSLNFEVISRVLKLGYYDADNTFIENEIQILPETTLAAGGDAQLSVIILDENDERVTAQEAVTFTSGCIDAAQSTLSPVNPVSVFAQAITVYSAVNCHGTDSITASIAGTEALAFGTMEIAASETNSINFVSAEPTLIVLRGTGGADRYETSDVVFTAIDQSGRPLPGVTVDFSLSTYVGGLSLSKSSQISNGDGEVSVTVHAGDVATTVRVLATVDNGTGTPVSTVSDLLAVTTGLPDQNSFSVGAACNFVVDGAMNTNDLSCPIEVLMSDKFNNPVVDGTAVVFTTEYGSIDGSCTTLDGRCSVVWNSQNPRLPTIEDNREYVVSVGNETDLSCPIPCPRDLSYIRGGRSTILVHAIGEESFVDENGNGVMDEGEPYQNVPEAFLDNNEDGAYTPALALCETSPDDLQCIGGREETFIDFNSNLAYDLNNDPELYNGLLCPAEGEGIWCSKELVNVRGSVILTLGDGPNWYLRAITFDQDDGTLGIQAYIADTYNNPPTGGSTVSLAAEGNCEIVGSTSFAVPNYSRIGNGAFPFTFTTKTEVKDPPEPAGSVQVTLSGYTNFWTIPCVN